MKIKDSTSQWTKNIARNSFIALCTCLYCHVEGSSNTAQDMGFYCELHLSSTE